MFRAFAEVEEVKEAKEAKEVEEEGLRNGSASGRRSVP
jgi:hypothetical protein